MKEISLFEQPKPINYARITLAESWIDFEFRKENTDGRMCHIATRAGAHQSFYAGDETGATGSWIPDL